MPNPPHATLLCRYHYDPLDRQSGCTLPQQPVIQRFHCDGRLTTEIQGSARWSILQHGDHLLAQRNHLEANVTATLLATDQQRSVLNALDASGPHPLAYTPYGHHPALHRLLSRRGFNGEQPDPLTGDYHLGNGYRQFSTVLMRFNSPDSWSPFGEGGLNAYGYCGGDPTNRVDPDGHVFKSFLGAVSKLFKSTKPEPRTTFEDLNQDIFHKLSKYLPSQDMNSLRLTSKVIKPKIDQASEHNFKVYLKGNSPHIFNPHKSATPLDKTIQVGLGKIQGISSAEATKRISVETAQTLYDTHTASNYSYNPTSSITAQSIYFTRHQRTQITYRHSISLGKESKTPAPDKGWIREVRPNGDMRMIRRGSR
ncbi:RHS repeat-associated protein [Pseudomonas sp. TE12234]